jgi:hypothetical protein
MSLVYMQKHKPWMESDEMRGFVDANENSWFKIGNMLERKHGEYLWDLWDSLEYDEQELYMDDARLAYPPPEEAVLDEDQYPTSWRFQKMETSIFRISVLALGNSPAAKRRPQPVCPIYGWPAR